MEILSGAESTKKMFEDTGCSAIMIGRAAIGNPWIFQNILSGKDARPSNAEIYDVIQRHYEMLTELKGEYVAVREMRKHIAAYIKGLPMAAEIRRKVNEIDSKEEVLELLCQKMNHRNMDF